MRRKWTSARTRCSTARPAATSSRHPQDFCVQIDRPTKQVMIEARLVEVTANPRQTYGINWAGVVGGARPDCATVATSGTVLSGAPERLERPDGTVGRTDSNLGNAIQQQPDRELLPSGSWPVRHPNSVPQLSADPAMRSMKTRTPNFSGQPTCRHCRQPYRRRSRSSTAQPVPQLNFNEQTATAVFGGFQDKKFGNTLIVTPLHQQGRLHHPLGEARDQQQSAATTPSSSRGATVTSPVIDTRTLESNVLIKSGDTLAIGGLLQDEVQKGRHQGAGARRHPGPRLSLPGQDQRTRQAQPARLRHARRSSISDYGTGLEDQVSGLHHSGEEYADPNGWRNNAKGAGAPRADLQSPACR